MDTIPDARSGLKGELFLEVLRTFGSARLRVTGTSMLPSIWPGDILEVRRPGEVKIASGELVLFERGGRFFAHRVVGMVEMPMAEVRAICRDAGTHQDILERAHPTTRNAPDTVSPGRFHPAPQPAATGPP